MAETIPNAIKHVPGLRGLGEALEQRLSPPKSPTVGDRLHEVVSDIAHLPGRLAGSAFGKLIKSELKDHNVQSIIAGAGGALSFGAAAAAFSTATGVVVGAILGLVPAPLTFGLSIPVTAIFCGATSFLLGSAVGAGTGGVATYSIYKYAPAMKNGVVFIAKASGLMIRTLAKKAKDKTVTSAWSAYDKASRASSAAVDTADHAAKTAMHTATASRPRATASAAVAGGAVGSVAGGTLGTLTGAAVGVVPALFTFGLSIPVGAVIGLCAGAFAGGAAGVVGGGVAGYTGIIGRKKDAQNTAAHVKIVPVAQADDTYKQVGDMAKKLGGA